MGDLANTVISAAATYRERPFFREGYGQSPYCASFVRWCYERATGLRFGLPQAKRIPYYVRKGIHVTQGVWFADSLAGDEIGPVVKAQQPGDLLFFHDTAAGPWPVGSITHVGLAVDAGDRMADAGSGSIVHFRSHIATFPGKLVEIRRPQVLGGGRVESRRRTAIAISGAQAFGMVRGEHARNLSVQFTSSSAPSSAHAGAPGAASGGGYGSGHGGAGTGGGVGYGAGGRGGHAGGQLPAAQRAERHRWMVMIDDRLIRPHSAQVDIEFGSQRFKLFGHDHIARAFMNGAKADDSVIRVVLHNGAAHVWINGREIKPTRVQIEIME